MKIVGWTSWDDPNYTEMFEDGMTYVGSDVAKVKSMIADELRLNGFKFDGTYHQHGETGVPVFDNHKTLKLKMYRGINRETEQFESTVCH